MPKLTKKRAAFRRRLVRTYRQCRKQHSQAQCQTHLGDMLSFACHAAPADKVRRALKKFHVSAQGSRAKLCKRMVPLAQKALTRKLKL